MLGLKMLLHRRESWRAEPENNWGKGNPGMSAAGEKGAVLGRRI